MIDPVAALGRVVKRVGRSKVSALDVIDPKLGMTPQVRVGENVRQMSRREDREAQREQQRVFTVLCHGQGGTDTGPGHRGASRDVAKRAAWLLGKSDHQRRVSPYRSRRRPRPLRNRHATMRDDRNGSTASGSWQGTFSFTHL